MTGLYRKGEVGPAYMKVVFNNLETYSDFAYILNSYSARCGIGEAKVLKAKIANKPLPSHSGEVLSRTNLYFLISKGES